MAADDKNVKVPIHAVLTMSANLEVEFLNNGKDQSNTGIVERLGQIHLTPHLAFVGPDVHLLPQDLQERAVKLALFHVLKWTLDDVLKSMGGEFSSTPVASIPAGRLQ